jgi:hypothetical protein
VRASARIVLAAAACLWLLPGTAMAGEAVELHVATVPAGAGSAVLTHLNAALYPHGPRVTPYVGVDGASLPQPDRSAGIPTGDVTRLDLRARAGLRLAAGENAGVRLFVTVSAATLDADNRLDTRSADPFAGVGLAFVRSF